MVRRSRSLLVLVVAALLGVLMTGPASAAPGPSGAWDQLTASSSTVSVSGWAMDAAQVTASVQVHVYVDGRGTALVADRSRPDVAAAFPGAGAAHGFAAELAVPPGNHSVCIYAISADGRSHSSLGCRSVATGLTPPVGSFDGGRRENYYVVVDGWALDPDDPARPVAVHVWSEGFGQAVVANRPRPDVGAAFPSAGPAHGWQATVTMQPFRPTVVCAWAIDLSGATAHTGLGCRTYTIGSTSPLGSWDTLSVDGADLHLDGWAFDPDQPGSTSSISVIVDGMITTTVANGSRPDVAAAFPAAGGAHGWSLDLTVQSGVHQVCVRAEDLERPDRPTNLGCRQVQTTTSIPRGNLDAVWVSDDLVHVLGWAFDPGRPASSVLIVLEADGDLYDIPTTEPRPDVAQAFPGVHGLTGFHAVLDLGGGTHWVCVEADSLDAAVDLGCRVVTV